MKYLIGLISAGALLVGIGIISAQAAHHQFGLSLNQRITIQMARCEVSAMRLYKTDGLNDFRQDYVNNCMISSGYFYDMEMGKCLQNMRAMQAISDKLMDPEEDEDCYKAVGWSLANL